MGSRRGCAASRCFGRQLRQISKSHLEGARNLYESFIEDCLFTDELISAALCFSSSRRSRRSGVFNEADLVTFDERDITDLKQLMSLARKQDFSSRKACYLHPALSSTRSNTDIIIDDRLIQIKTMKNLVLDRRHGRKHLPVAFRMMLNLLSLRG